MKKSEKRNDNQPPAKTCQDFIDTYVTYADVLEAPPESHQAVAISLLAAALNEKVFISYGAMTVTLDFWIILLSGSGYGRNTLISLARSILEKAALQKQIRNWPGSRSAFYQDLAENPNGMFVWPELSTNLKALNEPQFSGLKEWITDRYDNTTCPEDVVYRKTGKKSDTPSIGFLIPPRINILATSSESWFMTSLTLEDSAGGFLPRFALVRLPVSKRLISKPKKTDPTLIDPLANILKAAHKLKGSADLTLVEGQYDDWYKKAHVRFSKQPNSTLAMAYFNRLRVQVLKLAVIFEVSQSLSLKVTPSSMKRAIAFAKNIEETLFSLLPTGLSFEGSEIDKIEQRIKNAGPTGLLKSEFTRSFQYVKSREREDRLRTLIQGETVHAIQRRGGGRPAEVLVHKDHLQAYVAANSPPLQLHQAELKKAA
jgi:hypothetical protein